MSVNYQRKLTFKVIVSMKKQQVGSINAEIAGTWSGDMLGPTPDL